MGHNFGMHHDFGKKHGGTDDPQTSYNKCNNKGIMSYGDAPTVWSSCSVSDFTGYYNKMKWGDTILASKRIFKLKQDGILFYMMLNVL